MIIDSLSFCRANKGLRLYAYVIMENHLHLVAGAPDLSGVMRAFKGFTAMEIVALAEASGRRGLLNQFMLYKKRYKDASRHQSGRRARIRS
ncbi:MAG: transposase [Candidatus Hydrogenedentes bacterium]|nr:transposase [Candidatus Hydrogenedentota bacterium]